MTLSRAKWIAGVVGFLSPSLLVVIDVLPGTSLPGGLIYVAVGGAAILTASFIVTSRLPWWRRLLAVLGVWGLLATQVLVLGVLAFNASGLRGIQ
jgi:hypothetical protein